jgi:hypothetical protein
VATTVVCDYIIVVAQCWLGDYGISLVWIVIRGGGRRSEVGLCFEIKGLESECLGGTLAETAVVGYIVLLIHQRYASAPVDGQCKVNSRISRHVSCQLL